MLWKVGGLVIDSGKIKNRCNISILQDELGGTIINNISKIWNELSGTIINNISKIRNELGGTIINNISKIRNEFSGTIINKTLFNKYFTNCRKPSCGKNSKKQNLIYQIF